MVHPPVVPLPMPLSTLLWLQRPTQLMEYARRACGSTFKLQLPAFPLVLTSDRDAIRAMFAAKPDDMHAGRFNAILRPLVGDSALIVRDGAAHVQRRKLLMPAFHGERMRFYGNTMAEITRAAMASWHEGAVVSLHKCMQEITLQVILRTVFGADSAVLDGLSRHITRMMADTEHPLFLLLLAYLANHPHHQERAPWRWLALRKKRTDDMLFALIREARRYLRPGRKDVFAMLLEARDEHGEGLSDEELRGELMTVLVAGHDTMAATLAWTIERLLANPDAYRRARDEVRARGADPDPERLSSQPYLEALIIEVLRVRPVVPMVGRVLMKPYRLAGYDLPAGTPLGACSYLAQRDPEVYPDPDAFKPERFLDKMPDPATYFPFGGGLRRCIGAAFAHYEMKIVLGTMLASCDFELAQRSPLRIVRRAVTLAPEGGTRVRVKKCR